MSVCCCKEVTEKISIAVDCLLKHDVFLLEKNVNERSISHKLAEYLQKQFPQYHVDCEYNRMQGLRGEGFITKRLELGIEGKIAPDDIEAKTVFPDIIIHRRGSNEDNLVVLEIKKERHTNKANSDYDITKLKEFTQQLKYKLGMFLEFSADKVKNIKCVKDGKELKCPCKYIKGTRPMPLS